MTKLELFLDLFPIDFLNEVLFLKMNNLLKYPMDPGEFIKWIGCWVYMGYWDGISNRKKWWSTPEPTISEGASLRINKYISRKIFEGILSSIRYIDRNNVEYNDGLFHMHQMEEAWNTKIAEEFHP